MKRKDAILLYVKNTPHARKTIRMLMDWDPLYSIMENAVLLSIARARAQFLAVRFRLPYTNAKRAGTLTGEQARACKDLFERGYSLTALSKVFNADPKTIANTLSDVRQRSNLRVAAYRAQERKKRK